MRKNVGVIIDKEELNSIRLIYNKLAATSQMLKTIPEDVSQEAMNQYVNSVVDARGEVEWLQQNWWEAVILKYGLSSVNDLYVDFNDGNLFIEEKK
jgi:CXXX repeat modification system protein